MTFPAMTFSCELNVDEISGRRITRPPEIPLPT